MANPAKVRTASGTWVDLAVQSPDISNYSTTTQMNTAIDNAKGFVLIATANPSTAADVTVTNCFSSTYDSYMITWSGNGTVDTADIKYQLVSGTTPNTSSIYVHGRTYLTNGGGPFRSYASSDTSGKIGEVGLTSSLSKIFIDNPFASKITIATFDWTTFSTTPIIDSGVGFALHNSTSSFDGIKFLLSSGTMTGTFKIYGLKK